jgi:hypothetical protein
MINFQPANPQEQPQLAVNPANLRRRRALAEALAASAPKTVQNTGQGLAMMGMQAAGGFLDGMNERREQAAEQQRRLMQAQALTGVFGAQMPGGINPEQFRALASANPELAGALAKKMLENRLTPQERFETFTLPDGRQAQRSSLTGEIRVMPEGSAPAGYRLERDQQGNPLKMVPIPGGPVDQEQKDKAAKEAKSKVQDSRYANVVFRSMADIDSSMKGSWFPTTGGIGQLLSRVPGTEPHNIAKSLDSVKANIGFERLNAMRAASPTGGALGNVTERELALLTSAAGNLEQSQTPAQFKRNLERLRSDFEYVIHGRTFSPEERKKLDESERQDADKGQARPDFMQPQGSPPAPAPVQGQPQAAPIQEGPPQAAPAPAPPLDAIEAEIMRRQEMERQRQFLQQSQMGVSP